MAESSAPKPAPHPLVAALAITALALLVSGVLDLLGSLRSVDDGLARWFGGLGLGGELVTLERYWVWVWTVPVTFGLAWAVLHVGPAWQRWVLVLTALVLTAAWLPVLGLMQVGAPLGVPGVALAWVGAGSLVYAARHADPG
jgi:hypothetical protein